MRLPSKVTPYKKSDLSKLPLAIKLLQEGDIGPVELFRKMKQSNVDIVDYIEIMDCLYLLGRIDFLPLTEVLHYVEEDTV